MMDLITLLLVLLSAIVGASISYFWARNKQPQSEEMSSSKEAIEKIRQGYEQKIIAINEQKSKTEQLLSEAIARNEELSFQLKEFADSGKVNPELSEKLSDTDKLNKKIKQLEDELEDFEDDLADANKKLRSKVADNERLQEEKRKIEKEYQQAAAQLNEARTELEEKTQVLSLKMESLSFVQTILSAPESKNNQASSLYLKVNALSDYILGDFQDTMKSFNPQKCNESKGLFGNDLKRWEAVKKKSWIAGKTAIAFVGEFSAGKTSIVNRILSQDDPSVPLLPVSTKATTAIPTYISGGIKTDYQFFTQDNKLKDINAEAFNRVTKDVLDQVGGVSNLIRYFVMTYKNPYLESLSILDTPGFNSNDKEDSERTLEVINECDALFWVFDVNAGNVNQSSIDIIDLIKTNLHKPLYIVINKVDTKADSEVDKVEALIKESFQREDIPIEGFVRFSAESPLDNIMSPIKSIKTTSRDGGYLDAIKDFTIEMKKIANDNLKAKSEAYKQFNAEFEESINSFDNTCNALLSNCEYAASILMESWTVQGFSSFWGNEDKYELSKEKGDELKETIIDDIAGDNVNMVRNNCELISEMSKKLQEAYSALLDSKKQMQLLQKADERLRQSINNLKK